MDARTAASAKLTSIFIIPQLFEAGVHLLCEPAPGAAAGVAQQDGDGHHEVYFPVRVGAVRLLVRSQPAAVVLRRHGTPAVSQFHPVVGPRRRQE